MSLTASVGSSKSSSIGARPVSIDKALRVQSSVGLSDDFCVADVRVLSGGRWLGEAPAIGVGILGDTKSGGVREGMYAKWILKKL